MKKKRDYNRNEYVPFRHNSLKNQRCFLKPFFQIIMSLLSYFEKKKTYVSGLGVCIFVALYVWMFVAGANKVEGTMS